MDLRQLEYFVAVAEEANFTRAAERVRISQSGVSAQIRALERELGADLFDRTGRAARLTTAGRAAIGPAREALAAAGSVRSAVDEVSGLVRGGLTMGMIIGCEVTPLFDALAAFHRAYPGIEIALQEDNSDKLLEAVRSGRTDIALVGVAGAPPDGLDRLVIVSEGLVALVPDTHPLAGRPRLDLAELITYDLICLPVGTGIRGVLDDAGGGSAVTLSATAPGAVADLAARGLGVGVLAESMGDRFPGLTAIPIDGLRQPALLALVWRGPGSPAVRALVPHCRAAFSRSGPPPGR
jgi:DNA-binding transcriptional LysR family regulator